MVYFKSIVKKISRKLNVLKNTHVWCEYVLMGSCHHDTFFLAQSKITSYHYVMKGDDATVRGDR